MVARDSGHRHDVIGRIVAISAMLHPAVTGLQVDESVNVGGGALVGVDAATGC